MYTLVSCSIPGCLLITPRITNDRRGTFVKTFQVEEFARLGLPTGFAEDYFTESKATVIRGMHLQVPPFSHSKLVHCIEGQILDVVFDLRIGSPAYGTFFAVELSSANRQLIYIPEGLAHGFFVRSRSAIVCYKTTAVYSALHDTGVRWDSFGFDWPASTPILSDRDRSLDTFGSFKSPFSFTPHQ